MFLLSFFYNSNCLPLNKLQELNSTRTIHYPNYRNDNFFKILSKSRDLSLHMHIKWRTSLVKGFEQVARISGLLFPKVLLSIDLRDHWCQWFLRSTVCRLMITCSKHFTKELTYNDLLWVNSQEEIILATEMCCDGAMMSVKKKHPK